MHVAAFEFLVWSMIGLALGLAGHFCRSHFNPSPDLREEDRAYFNLEPTKFGASSYVEGGEYNEAGYWDYYSWSNLRWYLTGGLVSVLGGVYLSADGHAAARDTLCKGVGVIGLVPIFCP
jgi:hypothetical protein